MWRRDGARSGRSTSTSDLTKPVPYWRTYLGGSLDARNVLVSNVSGDKEPELVYIEAGRAIARTLDGTFLWKTALLDLTSLFGEGDFDGDGRREIVVGNAAHALVLRASDGSVVWTEPDGEMASLSGARLGDVSGDGKTDLVLKECNCCNVTKTGPGLYAYSFANGYGAPTQLFAAAPYGCGADSLTLFDSDGDGRLEIAIADDGTFHALGATGFAIASAPPLGTRLAYATCEAINIDGQPGDELACAQNVNQGNGLGGRRVIVLKLSGGTPPALSVVWQANIGDYDNGDMFAPPGFAAKLDDTESQTLVVAGQRADGVWATHVYDAANGALLTTLDGQKAVGVMRPAETGAALVLTTANEVLTAWSLTRSPSAALAQRWTVAGVSPVASIDWSLRATSGRDSVLLGVDWDGNGSGDFVTQTVNTAAPVTLTARSLVNNGKEMARYAVPTGIDVPFGLSLAGATAAVAAFMQSDGRLVALTAAGIPPAGGNAGIPFGGYYSGAHGFGS
ncbi:MAG TPA: VCBS repeat-containing protein, partial [Polyangiaceae bacterium]|nr:VCBS repeat-containing protein [Polyangiaceae bacterium]